jgi:predicted nucleic acid-binding protein
VAERYVLDTSAIFSFTDQEEGAAEVERILERAGQGQCRVDVCSASLMEVYYTTLQEAGEDEASQVIGLIKSWPVHWVYPDEKDLLLAGRIKALHRLSFADAQIAATAKRTGATLVHKDPELMALDQEIDLLTLPLKRRPAADGDASGRDA